MPPADSSPQSQPSSSGHASRDSSAPVASAQPSVTRHVLPILLGGLVTFLLTLVTDNVLGAHGWLPADPLATSSLSLALFALYRGVFTLLGCHLAARAAPDGQPRIRYALALGVLLLLLNLATAVTQWGNAPAWYFIAGIVLTVPCAIVGGGTAARVIATRSTRS
jgi:hypothetical protein